MDRALPEVNRVVHQRNLNLQKRIHRDKIKYITPRIDNGQPGAMAYPISRGKKEQIIEGKYHFLLRKLLTFIFHINLQKDVMRSRSQIKLCYRGCKVSSQGRLHTRATHLLEQALSQEVLQATHSKLQDSQARKELVRTNLISERRVSGKMLQQMPRMSWI